LGGSHRLEAAHHALPHAGRLMRLLAPVGAAHRRADLDMLGRLQLGHPGQRRGKAPQLVRLDPIGRHAVRGGQEAPDELLGGCRVAVPLQEHVERLPVRVDGAPEPVPPAADPRGQLIQVSRPARAYRAPPELLGGVRPELRDLAAHRLVGDRDDPLGEDRLDVAVAQGEPEVEPHGARDELAKGSGGPGTEWRARA